MPGTRPSPISVSSEDASSGDALSAPHIAMQTALGVIEIRRNVLSHLPRHDVVQIMRVGREWFLDAVAVVYRAIPYKVVERMISSPRADTYAATVQNVGEVFATSDYIQDRYHPPSERLYPTNLSYTGYRPGDIEPSVASLLAQFPALRRISFKGGKSVENITEEGWRVTLAPSRDTYPSTGAAILGGHIDLVYSLSPNNPPPAELPSYSPPPNFTLRARFNLIPHLKLPLEDSFSPFATRDQYHPGWLVALREQSYWGHLHHHLDLDVIPVELGDITRLYELQKAAGYSEGDRIRSVTAFSRSPWKVSAFMTFAQIASASLVFLDLGAPKQLPIPLNHVPHLFPIVRRHLSSLRQLSIAMGSPGLLAVETLVLPASTDSCLDERGSLVDLRIRTPDSPSRYLNTIKYLSMSCAAGAKIHIGGESSIEGENQCQAMQYLRDLSPARKKHVAAIDFALLDVTEYAEIYALEYDDSDKPIRAGVIIANGLINRIQNFNSNLTFNLDPRVTELCAGLEDAAYWLQMARESTDHSELLSAARAVLSSARAFRLGMWKLKDIARASDAVVTQATGLVYTLERTMR